VLRSCARERERETETDIRDPYNRPSSQYVAEAKCGREEAGIVKIGPSKQKTTIPHPP